jgi:hypothetical protein
MELSFIFVVLAIGGGMFMLGWYTRGLKAQQEVDAVPPTTVWKCPKCEKTKALPTDLQARVLVCNNCECRMVREVV